MEIHIPQKVTNNFRGYTLFTEIYHHTKAARGENITFNFEETKVFESNLFSTLACLISDLERRKNTISFINIKKPLENLFNLKRMLNSDSRGKVWKNLVKCKQFGSHKEEFLSEYLETKIFPEKSSSCIINQHLKMAIELCVAEIFRNAFAHSNCKELFISHYYSVYNKKLYISIVNQGKSIPDLKRDCDAEGAIEWATKNGTTSTNSQHKGIGLYTIRQFIQQNQGKIQILSGKGVWKQVKHRIFSKAFHKSFPGTFVTLEFNLE